MNLRKTVFYAHKKLYFNKGTGSWNHRPNQGNILVEEGDFIFDDESDQDSNGMNQLNMSIS